MPSKLGFQGIDSWDVQGVIRSGTSIVKAVGDRGTLSTLHAALGDSTTYIARIASTEPPVEDDFLRYKGSDDPIRTAYRWINDMRPVMLLNPFAYWESFNEMAHWDSLGAYGMFEAERLRLMHEEGFKGCIGNFAVGTPQITDEGDVWTRFHPALEACHRYKGILGLHEYGGLFLDLWYDGDKYNVYPDTRLEGWLFTRYRKVWRRHIAPNGWTDIRIALTEFGLDDAGTTAVERIAGRRVGPWRQCKPIWREQFGRWDGEQFYFEQLLWADRQMQKDDFLVGATIFCWGSKPDTRWAEFDVKGLVADKLVEYIRASRGVPTPPTAPIPVPVPAPPPAPLPGIEYVRTTVRGQNLRRWPGLGEDIIGVVRPTDLLLVLSRENDWTQVRTTAGVEGWAASWLLEPAVPDEPKPIPVPTPTTGFHALAGLHGPADPSDGAWTEAVFSAIDAANMEVVKVLTGGGVGARVVERLMGMGVKLIIARLFAKIERRKTAAEFADEVLPGALELYQKGVRYFEVHNEPNIHTPQSPEGMWVAWQNGGEFAVWFLEVAAHLRRHMPEALFGWPGLSPGGDVVHNGILIRYDSDRFMAEAAATMRNADFLCMHRYWSAESGLTYVDAAYAVREFCNRFPKNSIFLTEFSNPGSAPAEVKAHEYVALYSLLQTMPSNFVAAVAFIVSASSGFSAEAWVGTVIPRIVGLRSPSPLPTPTPAPTTPRFRVTRGGLRLRSSAEFGDDNILLYLQWNALVWDLREADGVWRRVQTTNGRVGWASSEFLARAA